MFRNRIIYLVFLISACLFATFYGGNITYMFFYLAIFLPLFCLIYTLYVNFRFKIHQTIGRVKIVKKEAVPYSFILANEDIFTFSSIKVSFFDDKSHIQQVETKEAYCLPPKSSNKMEGTIYGDYRGTYEVGSNSVEITDFLNLFSIRYPVRSKLKMIVSPRVISIEKLKLASFIADPRKTKNSIQPLNEIVDIQLRKYEKGDNRKLIHWKASAKKQELLTKTYTDIEELETFLLMDMKSFSTDEETTLIGEDKIIEITLAIANNFLKSQVPVRILYETNKIINMPVQNTKEFEDFYNQCVNLSFQANTDVETLLQNVIDRNPEHNYYIMVTARLTNELYEKLYVTRKNGKQIILFYVQTTRDDSKKNLLDSLRDIGISIYDIWMDDDLEELYS